MKAEPEPLRTTRSDVEARRRRRAVMRAHHPDLGGDPAEFIEVLRRLDQGSETEGPPTEVRFVRRRRWWVLDPPRPFRTRRPRRVH